MRNMPTALVVALTNINFAFSNLKTCKISGFDAITPEMIRIADNSLAVNMIRLLLLVPYRYFLYSLFCYFIIVSVVKDKNGNNDFFDNTDLFLL